MYRVGINTYDHDGYYDNLSVELGLTEANALAETLNKMFPDSDVWIEDESTMIVSVYAPEDSAFPPIVGKLRVKAR